MKNLIQDWKRWRARRRSYLRTYRMMRAHGYSRAFSRDYARANH